MWPRTGGIEHGSRTDVMKMAGNRSNINAFILKLVDVVFGREGLEQIQTQHVAHSEGYAFIKGKLFSWRRAWEKKFLSSRSNEK